MSQNPDSPAVTLAPDVHIIAMTTNAALPHTELTGADDYMKALVAFADPIVPCRGSPWSSRPGSGRGYGSKPAAAIGCVAAGRDLGAAWHSPADVMTSADLVVAAHREGLWTVVWTVSDPARMADLAELEVDGIVTDRRDLLRQVLAASGGQQPQP